jgi:hypothetical protein
MLSANMTQPPKCFVAVITGHYRSVAPPNTMLQASAQGSQKMLITPSKIVSVRRPGSKLTRVDFLLIAAILLVFAVTGAVYHLTSGQKNSAALISADLPDWTSHSSSGEAPLKARIGFARRIGT